MAPAVSSLTYSAPSGPGTASTGRPHRLPFAPWKPATSVIAGRSVPATVSHGIHNTAGGWGGWRSHEPWTATTAPPDHGAESLLPSRKARPSGALWAARPTSIGDKLAQSKAVPPGLVRASATKGTSASDPAA